jgi:hypothetical protein
MLHVYIDMEKHYVSPNRNPASAPVLSNRDQQLLMLYYNICDYLGLSAGQAERLIPGSGNSSQDVEYLLAISG